MAIEARERSAPDARGDDEGPPRRLLSHRALYGYGPLLAFLVLFGLMMALLPSVVSEDEAQGSGDTTKSAEDLGLTPGSKGKAGTEGRGPRTATTLPAKTSGCADRNE